MISNTDYLNGYAQKETINRNAISILDAIIILEDIIILVAIFILEAIIFLEAICFQEALQPRYQIIDWECHHQADLIGERRKRKKGGPGLSKNYWDWEIIVEDAKKSINVFCI